MVDGVEIRKTNRNQLNQLLLIPTVPSLLLLVLRQDGPEKKESRQDNSGLHFQIRTDLYSDGC
jgi:hypothetical protein